MGLLVRKRCPVKTARARETTRMRCEDMRRLREVDDPAADPGDTPQGDTGDGEVIEIDSDSDSE